VSKISTHARRVPTLNGEQKYSLKHFINTITMNNIKSDNSTEKTQQTELTD